MEQEDRVTIGAGDVVFVRTGRWVRQRALGPVDPTKTQAGPHPMLAEWLHRRRVALIGGDGANDRAPSVVPGVSHPFHMLALVAMGMPLLDNMDLDELAAECGQARRWTFLFVGTPLRIKDATGSPLNAVGVSDPQRVHLVASPELRNTHVAQHRRTAAAGHLGAALRKSIQSNQLEPDW